MKKGFSFPEVAKNDFASNLFEEFEIAEKNLNSNLDNVDLFNTFVEQADKVKKQLKEKYSDQWTDPADGDAPQVKEDEDWPPRVTTYLSQWIEENLREKANTHQH